MKLRHSARTDVGRTRDHNEDSYGIGEGEPAERLGMLLVVWLKTPVAFLALLIAMKTLLELAQALSTVTSAAQMPDEAPRWFRAMFKATDLDVAREWKEMVDKKREQELADERPAAPGGRGTGKSRRRGKRKRSVARGD